MTRYTKDKFLDLIDIINQCIDDHDLDSAKSRLRDLKFRLDYQYFDNIKLPESVCNGIKQLNALEEHGAIINIRDILDFFEKPKFDPENPFVLSESLYKWINSNESNLNKFIIAFLTGYYEEQIMYAVYTKDRKYVLDISGSYFDVFDSKEKLGHLTTRKRLEECGLWKNSRVIVEYVMV